MEIKLPLYNLLNMLLTGFIFIGGCSVLFPENVVGILNCGIFQKLGTGPEIILVSCVFAIAYETGMIINRIGSVVIESVMKKFSLIPFDGDYAKFNKYKKFYPIMEVLSREYALYRTSVTLFGILAGIAFYSCQCLLGVGFLLVSIIYFVSWYKYAAKIVALMQSGEEYESENQTKNSTDTRGKNS